MSSLNPPHDAGYSGAEGTSPPVEEGAPLAAGAASPPPANPLHAAMYRVVDESKLQPAQWRIWALSAMGILLDGFDLFVISAAIALITVDLNANPAMVGMIGAAALLGAFVGAFVGGYLTDRFGRKKVLIGDMVVFIAFGLLSGFSWDVASLIFFRFLVGVGIGADYPLCASYVSEFMPARIRGRMLVGAFSFQAVGMIAAGLVALTVLALDPQVDTWRFMLIAPVFIGVVVLILRFSLPESPRWLMKKGRDTEAVRVMSGMFPEKKAELEDLLAQYGTHAGVDAPPVASRDEELAATRAQYAKLFSPEYRNRTILTTGAWFFMDIATYGVGLFTPILIAAMAFSGDINLSVIGKDFDSVEWSAFLEIFLIAGFLLNIWLVERIGRIKLQLAGFAGMVIGLLILAFADATSGANAPNIALIFVGFGLFNLLMNMGPNATTFAIPAELFPTELRATAHGLAAAVAKFGATLGIFLLPIIQSMAGTTITLILMAIVGGAGFAITWFYGIETRGTALQE